MTAVPKPPHRMKPRPKARVGGAIVTFGQLRQFVFARDRGCLAKSYDPRHTCRGDLTLEHVTAVHGPEDPRRDDERHTVALCFGINGDSIASRELRELLRRRLRTLYPECRAG
jgi:hypothetical protein